MRLSTSQKYASAILVAFLILAVGALSVRSARAAQRAARWVAHTHEVLAAIEGVGSDLRDVETGQRGFVITGEPGYLEPYELGIRRAGADLARLRRLTADNPGQQARLDSLAPVIDRRIAFSRSVVELRRASGLGPASALVLTDTGRRVMDDIRQRLATLRQEEERLLERRTMVGAARERDVAVVTTIGTLVAFALVLLITHALYQDVRAKARLVEERDRLLGQERATRIELEAIQRITDATLAPLGIDELLTELMARLREVLAADAACVHLVMRDGVTLELCKCVGVSEEVEERVHVPIGRGVVGRIATGGAPAAVDDLSREEVVDPVMRERFASLLGAPLVVRGRVIGVVHVETVARRHFEPHELQLIGLVAERAASAVERARSYQAERRSEERFRLLVEGVHDHAIFMLDPDGRITSWNEGAARLKGYRVDDILGRPLSTFFTPEDRAAGRPDALMRIAVETGSATDEGWRVRRDGSRFWAEATTTALRDDDGHLLGFAKVTRDLSERRAAEQALVAAREVAEEARARAEEANAAKSQFLATMSHELRTPLNAILGYVDLFELGLEGPVTPGQQNYLARVRASGRHLLGLVSEILDLARLEARQLHVERVRASCTDAIGAALALVYPQAASRGLSVANGCPPDDAPEYFGDPNRVEQILVNLLSNAVKFTEPGGRIAIACTRTRVPDPRARLGGGEAWCRVAVEDSGVGIHPAQLSTVFEPFVQASQANAYTRTQGGAGLGLAISRRLARLMGGDVTATSEPGRGSTFTLWLPSPADEPSHAKHDGGDPHGAGARAVSGDGARAPVHLAPLGAYLRRHADDVVQEVARRLRVDAGVPDAAALTSAQLEDHVGSLVAEFAQSLAFADEATGEAASLIRDGRDIQRLVAERHGAQRHVLGWSEDMVRRGLKVVAEAIRDVLLRTTHERAHGGDAAQTPADVRAAIAMVERLAARATDAALRGWRRAALESPSGTRDAAP